jgi:cystathionine gamma-synthase
LKSATECLRYASSTKRDDGKEKDHVPQGSIFIRAFQAKDYLWAVIFAEQYLPLVQGFWSRPGVGISSRCAEANLAFREQLREVDIESITYTRSSFESTEHEALRRKIVSYVDRANQRPSDSRAPAPSDVYLFPSGMASIYKPHTYLSSLYNGKTVLFGMAFMDTVVALEEYGAGFKFLGLGSDEDLEALEIYLQEQHALGQKVQAIWAEFPANPLLITPDLARLRALADTYDVLLAIDDTISGFANVEILHMTDLLVTSLTKSFNGYADVIAGSVVLNPNARHYGELKELFTQQYVPELHVEDVKTLLRNSDDYLERTNTLNQNAKALVDYLQACAEDPDSAVARVYYPSTNPSGRFYTQFLRKTTPELTPGSGCLFSIELEDISTTIAFFNNLNVHNSVHLGAPFTLAFAYTKCTYGQRLDWAAQYGLRPTQIRVTAGLEDTDLLLKDFQHAVNAANLARNRNIERK